MERAALIAIGLAVLVSGCADAAKDAATDGDAPQETDTVDREPKTFNVTYTDSGFQPATLTIQKGDTVRWVDQASGDMWVASDRHPTHTNYAGTSLAQHCPDGSDTAFDQCESGETYSFTFQKTGEWSYHNHVAPADSGTVVVK